MSVTASMVVTMSIPTSQDLAGFESWLFVNSVASAIKRRRPDLDDQGVVVLDEDLPSPAVKMKLPERRCVLLARAKSGHSVIPWVIGTPDGHVARVEEPGRAQAIASLMIAAYLRFADAPTR